MKRPGNLHSVSIHAVIQTESIYTMRNYTSYIWVSSSFLVISIHQGLAVCVEKSHHHLQRILDEGSQVLHVAACVAIV